MCLNTCCLHFGFVAGMFRCQGHTDCSATRQCSEARRPQVALEDAYEWSAARCIMDVGGGRGEMLSRGMACAGPGCRGILMDRPWVLDRCVQP